VVLEAKDRLVVGVLDTGFGFLVRCGGGLSVRMSSPGMGGTPGIVGNE
jgi:hypothetical protein